MPAAGVKIQEIDLSSVVASFEGVYGAIVVKAKKGGSEPVLCSSDRRFLDVFTPDSRVEVGYDLAHFSALSFLESADKLWVKRVHNGATYSGAVIKESSSTNVSYALSGVNLTDPSAFVFDAAEDIVAVAKVQDLTVVADVAGSLDAQGVLLYDENGSVAFWIDVDDSGTTIPVWASAADRAVEITTIVSNDVANDVASKVQAVIDADAAFTASAALDVVTVSNVYEGVIADAVDNGLTSSISTVTEGVDAVDVDDDAILFHGSSEGAWASKIGIKITNFTDDEDLVAEEDAFLLEIFKEGFEGTPVESFLCSRIEGKKSEGRNIYVEDVLEGSNYVRAINNPLVAGTYPKTQATILWLADGDDGLAVTDSNLVTACQDFANPAKLPVTILMDGGNAVPSYQVALDTIAKNRMDCVAILSTPYSDEVSANYLNDLVDYRKTDLNLNSSYSGLYTPHVRIQDRFNDRRIFIAPDGFVAGRISFSANQREIWFPAAGFRRGVINAIGLSRDFEEGELDQLQNVGINPIRFFPGRGIVIWGQKTLSSRRSALDRMNVRLLLVVIEPAIKELLEDYLFELNDRATRSEVEQKIASYMTNIQARRGVTDFQVVCDETNNLPQDIDNNKLIVDLFIKPTRSIEYIPFRVVIVASGVSFSDAAAAI